MIRFCFVCLLLSVLIGLYCFSVLFYCVSFLLFSFVRFLCCFYSFCCFGGHSSDFTFLHIFSLSFGFFMFMFFCLSVVCFRVFSGDGVEV